MTPQQYISLHAEYLQICPFRYYDEHGVMPKPIKSHLVDFRHGNFERANLSFSILKGKTFYMANLQGANLEGANFEASHFRGANLKNANLKNANLKNANLEGANLEGANLDGANLEGAIFSNR